MSSQSKARKIVEKNTIPELDSLFISNFLINGSIKIFVNQLNSRVVPFSFVEMFFNALEKSEMVNNNKILKTFFENKKTSVSTYCYIYFLTFKQVATAVIEDKKYGMALVLKKAQEPQGIIPYIKEAPHLNVPLEILQQQIYAFSYQTENYARKAFAQYLTGNPNYISNADGEQADQSSNLVGAEIDISGFSGKKVYRLYIPTLQLPTKFPAKTSRIHSSYFAKSFSTPTTAVDFLSTFGIVQVKYKQSFIELREESTPKKPEKKLNWSDFF